MTIDTIRTGIFATKARIAALEAAGQPAEQALRLLCAHFERAAGNYDDVIDKLARQTAAARREGDIGFSLATGEIFDAPGEFLLGAVFKHLGKPILADVRAALRRLDDLPQGVADADRAEALAGLRADLRALERREEAEIMAQAIMGNFIARRPDADPAAVLGIPETVCQEFAL